VLNPGTLIGRDTVVYPGTIWNGVAPAQSIIKHRQEHEIIPRKS
jgi:hypothetical protein